MSKKNDRVSDFEWQSAAAFFRYVEVNAGLADYSLSAVYSFHITEKTGIKGLVARKLALLRILKKNLENIEKWAKANSEQIGKYQLVFVRSLYLTTKDLGNIVLDQVERAHKLAALEEKVKPYVSQEEEVQDEFPF